MNILYKKIAVVPLLLLIMSCNVSRDNTNTLVSIKTTLGEIKIKLYDGTPLHRDNFINLINSGIYEGVSFHRVIKDFMIQAGDPATRTVPLSSAADSLKNYTIPAEFNSNYFHKKGALAAAREGNEVNPDMRSSGTQFYIVQGIKYNDADLDKAEQKINSNIKQAIFNKLIKSTADSIRLSGTPASDSKIQEIAAVKMFQFLTTNKDYKIPDEQRIVYKTSGGTPRLDCTYTVFGEVTEGLDILDKIASEPTDTNDKPIKDVKIIKIRILKK
jgi:peptidylprolyl isomerase